MISEPTKARALALMKHQVPLEEISEELELPLMLVRDWHKQMSGKDLVALEANIHAVEHVLQGEVLEKDKIEILKDKLEDAAIEVTKDISMAMGDPMYAKSLQLCADTIAKLYVSIVKKDTPTEGSNNIFNPNGLTAFQSVMRD